MDLYYDDGCRCAAYSEGECGCGLYVGLDQRRLIALREQILELADAYDARYGPFPNGFCHSLTIHEVTGALRALVKKK